MSDQTTKRPPQVFEADDPVLVVAPVEPPPSPREAAVGEAAIDAPAGWSKRSSVGWLSIFVSALVGLATLAASVSFAHFVSVALAREDWVGILAWGLLGIAALSGAALALREIIGLMRLGRLARLRRDAEAAQRSGDIKAERVVVRRLRASFSGRKDLAWAVARFREHEGDVRDKGELMALADRELIAPLDAQGRRLILASAKRVSMVTAISPIALIAVGFVLVENLRLLRGLATLYGGRPGFLGGLRLARMVIVHLLATGGVAMTDDLIGQFIGQDLMRRLSRRLGEGVFNGALTARIGTVALEVCRPLPFIEAPPVRIRDVLAEFMRRPGRDTKERQPKG